MEPKGIEQQARPLPLVILADTSSSMQERGKISSLNQALAALVQDLQADEFTKESVLLSLITFDNQARDVLTLQQLKAVTLPTLAANGSTCMGQAFRLALSQLAGVPRRCLIPVIVLASDGQPMDEWRAPLQEIQSHPRAGGSLRLALAIGADADRNMLSQFVTPEYPVLKADEPEKIKTFFKWVTLVTRAVYTSGGHNRGGQSPPGDLLP